MTATEILALQCVRWRRPWPWAVLLGWTLLSAVPPVIQMGTRFTAAAWAAWIASQFLTYGSLAWMGPWPWLWSGRPQGVPGRGRAWTWGGLVGLGGLGLVTLAEVLRHAAFQGTPMLSQFRVELLENGIIYLATFGLVGFGLAALEREAMARAEAERRAKEAQWVLLRGQLSPHVLFNGMNNLARLVRKDPDRAERAAEDMAELFRRLMDHAHRHLSPLVEERELVQRYLSLESLRLGDRLQVIWDWDPALDALEAPPFLLQPLVENALKHGLAPHPEGGTLRVSGHVNGPRVELTVANTGLPYQGREKGGHGLGNLEARLTLAFQELGTFSIGMENHRTVARVSFPRLEEM